MIPDSILSSPSLLFLYYRIEEILGIKPAPESLVKLNEYLEKCTGASFVDDPAAFECILSSREQVFEISKLLTIAETYFFREEAHFDLLVKLLPQYTNLNRPIQICSAATSTGCEAYSIAMLLDYHSKSMRFNYEIDAFDINTEVIETAKTGRYTANALRTDGSAWKYILDSYLIPNGAEYIVSQDIRRKVRFFTHNIMNSLEKQYDVIFFRNALIYFTPRNRFIVINGITESLADNGVLFTGISETSSVNHPLLASRYSSNVFFFQKISGAHHSIKPYTKPEHTAAEKQDSFSSSDRRAGERRTDNRRVSERRILERRSKESVSNESSGYLDHPKILSQKPADYKEIKTLLENAEGQLNAKNTLHEILSDADSAVLSGSELAASVVFFLNIQDFDSADFVLSYMEKHNSEAFTFFLRGEYHLLQGSVKEAEEYFEKAAGKDRSFWPAFYRIAALAAEGNQTRYEYKIIKACESIELGKDFHYECFMGGFSPDYFHRILNRRILEKKLA